MEGELERGRALLRLERGCTRGIHTEYKGSGLRVILDHYFVQVYLVKVNPSRRRKQVFAEVCILVFPCVCHLGNFNFFEVIVNIVMRGGFIPNIQMGGNMSSQVILKF